MKIELLRLKNGLRVLFLFREDIKTNLFLFGVKVGSDNEKKGEEGLAHFLEHLIFKGTTNFSNSRVIFKELEKIGGYFNGFTSNQYTTYYIKTLEEHSDRALFILADLIKNPLLSEQSMEEEKKVITEEIRSEYDRPSSRAFLNSLSLLYPNLPFGRSIAGFESSVRNFRRKKVVEFKKRFYVAKNSLLIAITKLVDKKNILNSINEKFNDLPGGKEFFYKDIRLTFRKLKIKIEKSRFNQVYLVMALHHDPITNEERILALQLANQVFGGITYSRLFLSLREEKNLCYFCQSFIHHFSNRINFFISAEINKDNLEESFKVLEEEVRKVLFYGFDNEEIEIAKSSLITSLVDVLEDPSKLARFYLYYYFILEKKNRKRILTENQIERMISLIKKIKKEIIQKEFSNFITKNRFAISLLVPEELDPKEEKILEIVDKIYK